MIHFPILSFTIFWPLIGALFILLFIHGNDKQSADSARKAALWTSLFPLVLALVIWYNFDNSVATFQFEEHKEWVTGYGIGYHLGIDGISLFFIVLTTVLMPICILASWNSITNRVQEYMIAFLVLETLVLGVFAALDFVLFYLFFEAVLIPMYLIIGIWGGKDRVYASFKFFLYTLAGSVLLLIAMLYIYNQTGTMDIPVLMEKAPAFAKEVQMWLWLAFLASFAVKVPMWPVHTWLPDAHVQAPTAGSVILAGILLKLGGYGFLRLSLPMLPDASVYFAPLMFGLSVIAVIYTSLVALVQSDMKKLIAYSSIAHMGFVTIGTFAFNQQGLEGAIFQMLSHGLVSGALFLCVGVVYDRMHTREIAEYGGLVNRMPKYAVVFMFFTMASIGLPGTSGFIGELLVLIGIFNVDKLVTALAATGVVLGAAYMLWLYARVVLGELKRQALKDIMDIDVFEIIVFIPLVISVLIMGIYPSIITDSLHASVIRLQEQMEPAIKLAKPEPEENVGNEKKALEEEGLLNAPATSSLLSEVKDNETFTSESEETGMAAIVPVPEEEQVQPIIIEEANGISGN